MENDAAFKREFDINGIGPSLVKYLSQNNPGKALPERSIMPGEVLPNSISSELANNQKIKHVTASLRDRCAATSQKISGSAIRVRNLLFSWTGKMNERQLQRWKDFSG
ncbi:hypothetical protein [Gimesia sp.]|uniref:hypothetical protein n=1 Tax=Gimesia sp. TaxID=2024833 RepID=UPI0025C0EE9D|nr:hypothetical protein [Gimesia sp.]|tara:strand:+ start:385 stop:708 length:324 start_codon:yes stop_codon:yes gene_type:complete